MSKGDFPALRMTVDGGRLVPATSFDQERLNSYRRGTVVFVKFTEERDRVLVRKWFAILGLVLKQCDTPWKNKDEAHEAIKLALGIVNLSKTVSGKFMQYPKSLAELDEPEMLDALEQMTELLSRMTGVDVATLKKEAADVGHELDTPDTPSGEAPSSPSPDDAAAPSVASEADDSAAPVPSSASIDTPWIVTAARMLWAATHPGGGLVATDECLDVLNNQRKAVGALMPEGTDQATRDKAGSIYTRCKQVVMREIDEHDAKAIISGIAGVSEEDLSNG